MRTLAAVDWLVIGVYSVVVLGAGVDPMRRAGRSVEVSFVGGRSLSWWLLGVDRGRGSVDARSAGSLRRRSGKPEPHSGRLEDKQDVDS